MTEMAEVAERIEKILIDHRVITDGLYEPTGWCETCGNLDRGDQEAHQSYVLAAVGYGPVKEARASALTDAADAAHDKEAGMDGSAIRMSEDRGFLQRHNVSAAARWLRARAAAERGGA